MSVAYLAKYGAPTLENGYEIIPIKPGTKRPPFDDWEAIRATPKTLRRWLDNGREANGVGILARKTPMVDIDCRDAAIVEKMIDFTVKLLGPSLERVGMAPKTGILYRTSTPFRKVNSKTYVDEDGGTHKLEVLGDGQQFVAYAIHPDTSKPYRWLDKHGPHETPWEDLPEITREDALEIAEEFERLAEKKGWKEKRTLKRLSDKRSADADEDDDFAFDKQKVELNTTELSLKLGLVPGADDYETWLQIGMALWHQYDGDDEGLMLWHEWSVQSDKYDQDALDEKWTTFKHEGKGREPVTARLILKLANEEERRIAGEQVDESRDEITSAKTVQELTEAARKVKRIAFEPLVRESIANLVAKRYKDITGEAMSKVSARNLTKFENPENTRKPKWLEGFVYIESDKVFYHTTNRMALDAEAFNAKHNRFMMTQKDRLEGRSGPEHTASQAALNVWQIDTAYRRMYMPDQDEFFTFNGQRFVNFYTEVGVPDMPEKFTDADRLAIRRVEMHLRHLFVSARDWKLLLDWMAYLAQTKKRVSWAPVIQGAEGDGKTFFYKLMAVVLGQENVRTIPGRAVQEQWTGWMEGHLLVFIEEVRLHGQNRFDALNNLKPLITNPIISIRTHGKPHYDIVNTASIMMTTNHKNGVPASGESSRYFPMFSRWQTKERLLAFMAKNPTYYDDLHDALEHGGALRKWLLEYEISEDFKPNGRAPQSSSWAEMIDLNKSEEQELFDTALKNSARPDFSKALLDATLLDDIFEEGAIQPLRSRALKQFLIDNGYRKLPKAVKIDGHVKVFWTQTPERFLTDAGVQRNDRIRAWLHDDL